MRINEQWHEQNRMPKNPSLETRINWHLEHARECSCRPITGEALSGNAETPPDNQRGDSKMRTAFQDPLEIAGLLL